MENHIIKFGQVKPSIASGDRKQLDSTTKIVKVFGPNRGAVLEVWKWVVVVGDDEEPSRSEVRRFR